MEYTKLGYIFLQEEDAISARSKAASFKGYPIRPDDVTIYWVDYSYSPIENYYYILYDKGIEDVLGDPVEFKVSLIDL